VIVKTFVAQERAAFIREVAGLTVSARRPAVLAVDPAKMLIVMSGPRRWAFRRRSAPRAVT
jgi:hypothetical protein